MLNNLNDEDLNQKIKNLARQERKLTQEVIEHIAEIDRRQLFLRMGYSSLYVYLTKEIGYSEGAAQRRIDASRLFQKIPEISEKIVQGSINLAQISKMQKTFRQIKKDSGVAVKVSIQQAVLEKLAHKDAIETDLLLAQEFQLEIKSDEKKKIQRDESVRLELTFSKDEMKLIEEARALLSCKTGGGLKDTLLEMAKKVIQAHKPKPPSQSRQLKQTEKINFTATVAVKNASAITNSSVTPKLRREILNRDQFCQFRDIKTGKLCGNKFFLEVDHIKPKWANGSNETQNLRALCKNHNLFRYSARI